MVVWRHAQKLQTLKENKRSIEIHNFRTFFVTSADQFLEGKGAEVVGRTLVHQEAGTSTSALEEWKSRTELHYFYGISVFYDGICYGICELMLVMMFYDNGLFFHPVDDYDDGEW